MPTPILKTRDGDFGSTNAWPESQTIGGKQGIGGFHPDDPFDINERSGGSRKHITQDEEN